MTEDRVWDTGLQPERTRLAWQRTALALLATGLVVARFVGHHHVALGVVIAAAACVLAGAIGILSTRRYDSLTRRLEAERPLPGGVVNLLTTLTFLVVGVGATLYTLLS